MQVQINKPVSIAGLTYGKGQHSIPKEHEKDWYLLALIQDGDAIVLRADDVQEESVAAESNTKKSKHK